MFFNTSYIQSLLYKSYMWEDQLKSMYCTSHAVLVSSRFWQAERHIKWSGDDVYCVAYYQRALRR